MKTRETCACGEPAIFYVWEVPVCGACNADWLTDERFTTGSINAALNQTDDPARIANYETHHRAYCAEATRRTKAWADSRRVAGVAVEVPTEAPQRHQRESTRGKRHV